MRPSAGEIAYGSTPGRWLLAVAVLGSGIVFLDGSVVNVAVPSIGEDLGADTASLQWVLNGYLLTLSSLILLGGALGDRLGRRRVFTAGLLAFTAASLLCAIAPSVELLIVARLLQGVGGALLTPGSLAMIESGFRPQDRARAIGAWSGLGGVAVAIGPLLGGWLIDVVSWRLIFLINVPIGIAVAYCATRFVPETRSANPPERLDGLGALLAATGLGGITYALIELPERGASASVVTTAAIGAFALIAFLETERRSRFPMVPLTLFRSRQFSGANLVTFAVYAALGGVLFLLVAFLQISAGYSAIAAGAATLPITLLMLLFSPRAGALAARIGARIPLTAGSLILAAAMLMMAGIDPGGGYLGSVFPAVLVFGIGLTAIVAPVTATVLGAAPSDSSGIASGINNAVARVGGLLAVAILPMLGGLSGDDLFDPARMADGFRAGMLGAAALAAIGGAIAWTMIDSRREPPPGEEEAAEATATAPPPQPSSAPSGGP